VRGRRDARARERERRGRVYVSVNRRSCGRRDNLPSGYGSPRTRDPRAHRPDRGRAGRQADELVDEAKAAGGGDHPVTVHAKMLRLELLKVKADLERELETWVPNCTRCGLDVHWVSGLGVTPGHWAHREPAPHGEPAV
jgi:hypothetical protein